MNDMDAFAEDIARHGVIRAFGIPGSGISLSLIDALERRDIAFHLTHFEGSGALMAATVGRLSGRAGLSLSIKGPGLVNAAPGIAAAWFEAFPLVHVAEAFAPDAPPSRAHKRIDQTALSRVIAKDTCVQGAPGGDFPALARTALAEEPGPVIVEMAPGDVEPPVPRSRPEPVRGDLSAAVKLAREAEKPVVIAGALAARAGLADGLRGLGFPVFSTAAAKGIIDETLPNAAGVFTGVGLELTPERQLLDRCDLVVGIGLTARECLAVEPFPAPLISVEAVATPGTHAFAPAARIDIADAEELLAALATTQWGLDELSQILTALHGRMQQDFLPGAVFREIENRFSRRARIVLDTGYFCTIGEHALRAASPELCLMSGQGRYMGTGVPMAIGAALHDPAIPTVGVLGDGGIAMYLAELRLAVRHRLPLLVVLMTDNAFGSIRTRAIRDGLTQAPLVMDGKGWTGVIESFGLPTMRAGTLAAVTDALKSWDPDSGPAFLEIPFSPDPYERMIAGIR